MRLLEKNIVASFWTYRYDSMEGFVLEEGLVSLLLAKNVFVVYLDIIVLAHCSSKS